MGRSSSAVRIHGFQTSMTGSEEPSRGGGERVGHKADDNCSIMPSADVHMAAVSTAATNRGVTASSGSCVFLASRPKAAEAPSRRSVLASRGVARAAVVASHSSQGVGRRSRSSLFSESCSMLLLGDRDSLSSSSSSVSMSLCVASLFSPLRSFLFFAAFVSTTTQRAMWWDNRLASGSTDRATLDNVCAQCERVWHSGPGSTTVSQTSTSRAARQVAEKMRLNASRAARGA